MKKSAPALLLACLVGTAHAMPFTPVEPVVDDYHGTTIVDPYRWLETREAPVHEWSHAQNAHTRSVLDALPGRAYLTRRMTELMEISVVDLPRVRGRLHFHSERKSNEAQPVLYVRTGPGGKPRQLLDVNTLDDSGLTAFEFYNPSRDGTMVAFGTYRSGDENTTLNVLRTRDGTWMADEIPGKVSSVYWLPDGSGFLYRRLRDLDDPYSGQIKLHMLGDHHIQDGLLYEQYREGPLATTWGPYATLDREARWLAMGYFTSTSANDLWFYDFRHWRQTGELVRTDLFIGEEGMTTVEIVGDTMFVHTTIGAPNGRVLAVNLIRPAQENWVELIPERSDAVIESVNVTRNALVVTWLRNAHNQVEVFDFKGRSRGTVALPGIGAVSVAAESDREEIFYSFTSFNEPRAIYRTDLRRKASALWVRPEVPVDPALVEVKQVWYPSRDGTRVSMFIIHRKGLALDGDRPAILYGYGGFNVSMTPAFSATLFPWLEAGGVYAVPNLRGGGEYGSEWHRAGMLDRKQNVFDDFIAAAEYLIAEDYTRPARLGIHGGSNGGLLTGAVMVQRPDLFGAVSIVVPLLDMLRYQHFLMARYWVPEYGDADDPDQFGFLRAYSPYHNITAGTAYPPALVTAGENDTRVHPLHARKMAAALQAATTSDPATRPILLWIDYDSGHGQGKPLHLRVRDVVDRYMFFSWQLGLGFD
jgi:prolyl oligopeptidase